MKTEFDKEANAVYIYLSDISPGEVAETISLNDSVKIDLDIEGKVLGIEILDASEHLPTATIKALALN